MNALDVQGLAREYRAYLNTEEGQIEKEKLRADVHIARDRFGISEIAAAAVVAEAYRTPLMVAVRRPPVDHGTMDFCACGAMFMNHGRYVDHVTVCRFAIDEKTGPRAQQWREKQ